MKVKRSFCFLLSMILFIGFTACDKDEDDKKNADSIVGTWSLVYSEGYEKENGKITDQWDDAADGSEWVFKSNGTMTFWDGDEKYMASYSYKDNKLYLGDEEEGDVFVFNVTTLTTDKLVLELKAKEGNYELYDKSTFERVK